MKLLNIGQIIRSERMKRGISQEDLVFDICTPATLSRLENNLHTPTRSIYTALLERIEHLGYISYSTSDNNIIFSNNTIYDCVYTTLDNNPKELLKYTNDINQYYDDPILIQQFNTAINSLMCKEYPKDLSSALIESIRLTITSFDESTPLDYILTNNEILLLFSLAKYYENNNNNVQAIHLQSNLLHCIEEYSSELNFSSCARLYKYLISLYVKDEQYNTALENIKKYTDYCKTHSIYNQIPDSACFESICKVKLGYNDPYIPVIDAYYYYLANDYNKKAEQIQKFCYEKLHISFKTNFK